MAAGTVPPTIRSFVEPFERNEKLKPVIAYFVVLAVGALFMEIDI